jgi:hypothetical protein
MDRSAAPSTSRSGRRPGGQAGQDAARRGFHGRADRQRPRCDGRQGTQPVDPALARHQRRQRQRHRPSTPRRAAPRLRQPPGTCDAPTPTRRRRVPPRGHPPSGDGYIARCPAHDDRSPSLSVSVNDTASCSSTATPDATSAPCSTPSRPPRRCSTPTGKSGATTANGPPAARPSPSTLHRRARHPALRRLPHRRQAVPAAPP